MLRFIATIKRHYIDNNTKMCVLSLADEAEDNAGDSYQGFAYTKLLGNGGLSLSHTQSYEQERGPIPRSFDRLLMLKTLRNAWKWQGKGSIHSEYVELVPPLIF